ncbi:hypothetical protein scyTo_0012101 [Scyliorhinus torazame]|uniref:XLF-like coiled-coil region domain-containing protein n=1 Tax=Scyliorhinus torazame TaxID=75743 RepID=A0A401P1W5_SCYTO|nr:hypothetical protein [Scyliorhinus torazame]
MCEEGEQDVLNVTPVCGVLHPGDSTHSIVALRSHKTPCFYDLDLICEVYSKQQVTQYQKDLQAWEKEKDRQRVEFTITERGLQDNQQPVRQRQCCKDLQESHKMTHKDLSPKIMKYKTLPPIKEPMETWEGQHSRKPVAGLWLKPMPAKPFLLHLGVTARSHSMEEYHTNFPTEVPKHYIMRNLVSEQLSPDPQPGGNGQTWGKWENNSVDLLLSASKENMKLVTDILTTVLRCLQGDMHFQRVLVEGTAEPIPYYRQFWSEEGEELAMKSNELANVQDADTGRIQESVNVRPVETKEKVPSTALVTTDAGQGQEPDNTQPTEADADLTLTVTVDGGHGQDQEADSSQRMETEGEEALSLQESSDEGLSQDPDNSQLTEAEEEMVSSKQWSIDGGQGQELDDAQPIEAEEEVNSITSATADIHQSLDVAGAEAEEEWLSEEIQASLSAIRIEEQLVRRRHLKRSTLEPLSVQDISLSKEDLNISLTTSEPFAGVVLSDPGNPAELNKRLKASVSAFCRHLREAVGPLMRDGGGDHLSGFSCERARNLLRISLRSELSGVPFYWIFHCTEAPLSMVSRHMICPLLNMMRALHRQTQDLMLLLERKDAEIRDYKENGATLSRDRLETKTFSPEEFKDRFLAEVRVIGLGRGGNVRDGLG